MNAPERYAKIGRDWYHKDKKKRPLTYLLKQAKTRAIKKGLDFNITEEDLVIPLLCPYLKVPFVWNHHKYTPSIDRIIPEKGYIKGNIEIITRLANSMKWNSTPEELISFARGVLDRVKEVAPC